MFGLDKWSSRASHEQDPAYDQLQQNMVPVTSVAGTCLQFIDPQISMHRSRLTDLTTQVSIHKPGSNPGQNKSNRTDDLH